MDPKKERRKDSEHPYISDYGSVFKTEDQPFTNSVTLTEGDKLKERTMKQL